MWSGLLKVRVASHHDVVANIVVCKRLERAVLVCHVAVPSVTVVWVLFGAEPGRDIDTGEDDLATDETPRGAAFTAGNKLAVEPVRESAVGLLEISRLTHQFSWSEPIRVLPASFDISVI